LAIRQSQLLLFVLVCIRREVQRPNVLVLLDANRTDEAVVADNSTLIVAESHGKKLSAFDIAGDGSLSNRRVWAVLGGYPDGICIDAGNAVW
jgi:SMP-30/gluconolaconase/LRE-like protein